MYVCLITVQNVVNNNRVKGETISQSWYETLKFLSQMLNNILI